MSGRPSWKSAEIGLFRPFSAFFALFRRVRRAPGKSRKRKKRAFFLRYPQICLNPHLLNPHLRHATGRGRGETNSGQHCARTWTLPKIHSKTQLWQHIRKRNTFLECLFKSMHSRVYPVSPDPLTLRGADSPPKFRGRPSKNTSKRGVFWSLRPLNFGG